MNQQEIPVKIPLTRGHVALVDAKHAHLVQRLKWFENKGYATRTVPTYNGKQETIFMHRWLWVHIMGHIPYDLEIDHTNGDKLDNLLENLRLVTRRQNAHNRKERREGKTTSKFVGVSWSNIANKWQAQIQVNGKQYHIGLFTNEEEASEAYQRALAEMEKERPGA